MKSCLKCVKKIFHPLPTTLYNYNSSRKKLVNRYIYLQPEFLLLAKDIPHKYREMLLISDFQNFHETSLGVPEKNCRAKNIFPTLDPTHSPRIPKKHFFQKKNYDFNRNVQRDDASINIKFYKIFHPKRGGGDTDKRKL